MRESNTLFLEINVHQLSTVFYQSCQVLCQSILGRTIYNPTRMTPQNSGITILLKDLHQLKLLLWLVL